MSAFVLPDVGEGLTEADILTWMVSVGDHVEVNDVLVEIETAKSVVELPSPFAGEVTALLVSEGQKVAVGTPIIDIADGSAAPTPPPTLVGYGPSDETPRRRHKLGVVREAASGPSARPLAAPPVRHLARTLGVDLADVRAEGPVIRRADVEAYVDAQAGPAAVRPAAPPAPVTVPRFVAEVVGESRVPASAVQRTMAEAMVRSAFTAPHATEWLTADVSRTVDLIENAKKSSGFAGLKLTATVVVAKAVCLAMRRTPLMNARWDDSGDDPVIAFPGTINLGIAVATDRGLIVPNIRDAHRLSLPELAGALQSLTDTARAGRTPPADQMGGTFSITNVGALGIDAGTPILNPGETGILAMGAIERRPWVDENDQIVPRWVTTLALSFDHRVVDGATAARFLRDVADILRDPAHALTF